MYIKNKKGQSMTEYVLICTAVIAVIVVLTTNKSTGIQGQLNSTLSNVINEINDEGQALDSSHALSPANAAGAPPPYTVAVNPS